MISYGWVLKKNACLGCILPLFPGSDGVIENGKNYFCGCSVKSAIAGDNKFYHPYSWVFDFRIDGFIQPFIACPLVGQGNGSSVRDGGGGGGTVSGSFSGTHLNLIGVYNMQIGNRNYLNVDSRQPQSDGQGNAQFGASNFMTVPRVPRWKQQDSDSEGDDFRANAGERTNAGEEGCVDKPPPYAVIDPLSREQNSVNGDEEGCVDKPPAYAGVDRLSGEQNSVNDADDINDDNNRDLVIDDVSVQDADEQQNSRCYRYICFCRLREDRN